MSKGKDKACNKRIAIMLVSFSLIFFTKYIPPPQGLGTAGMQVIGVFAGVLLLWLTVAIDWPSLLCMAALAFVPGMKMSVILSGSLGNSTFAFLMCTFMCTYALSQTPFIRRCAVGFVNSAFARRGPWSFTLLFFASILFLGSFISPTVLFVLYLPIVEEIYAVLRLEKGSPVASMLMIGLVICCGISSGMTPIAHVFPMMALGYYQTATGLAISYASYMAFAIPVGIISAGIMMLTFRFVMHPDMSVVKNTDVSSLKTAAPMNPREKAILLIFGAVVLLWVAPGIIKPIAPELAAYIDSFGTAMPPMLGAVAMSAVTYQGKPLMNFVDAMSKGIPWGSLIMCAATLSLGAAITNPDIGITAFLTELITPLTSTLAPVALVLLFALWAALQTNLSSNMVTVTVVCAIAIPICIATAGAVNTAAVAAIIGMLASYAFATPPAMPCVAIAGGSGWTTPGALMKYGFIMMFTATALTVLVGYPIASAMMG